MEFSNWCVVFVSLYCIHIIYRYIIKEFIKQLYMKYVQERVEQCVLCAKVLYEVSNYRISPNKRTRPNRRSPLDFLACNIPFLAKNFN